MPSDQPSIDDLLIHAERVRVLALRLCADAHQVDEAVQDAWVTALRRPPRHGGQLEAWLRKTVQSAIGMRGRQERRRRRREAAVALRGDAAGSDTAELVARAELQRVLVARVLALPSAERELVLRHYFEGEPVAVLARQLDTTADAIRARLRRARERLRTELEGGDGRRAFAQMVGATGSVPVAVSWWSAIAGVTLMTTTTKVVLGSAAVIAMTLLLMQWPAPVQPRLDGAPDVNPVADDRTADLSSEALVRSPVVDPTLSADTEVVTHSKSLTVRLMGLHPAAPWSTQIAVDIEARGHDDERSIAVAADGTFAIPLPAWAATAEAVEARLSAHDPWYAELDVRRDGAIVGDAPEWEVTVRPVGVLTGTVLDPQGAPIAAARVCAFAIRVDEVFPSGVPDRPVFATVNTGATGEFRLPVPVACPVLIVALPMHPMQLSGLTMTMRDSGIADNGQPRNDLLPASIPTETRFGVEQDLGELTLRTPVAIHGTVLWSDGTPIGGAEVCWSISGLQSPALDARLGLHASVYPSPPSGIRIATTATADADGRFSLLTEAGTRGVVMLTAIPHLVMLTWPLEDYMTFQWVEAPADVTLRMDHPIVSLRVLGAWRPGSPVQVQVRYDDDRVKGTVMFDAVANDDLRFVMQRERMTLRATATGLASPWVDVSTPPPPLVELLLEPTNEVTMTVELQAERPIRQATLDWHPRGAGRYAHFEPQRSDSDGPFRMLVEPGRYRLQVGPLAGEHNGEFVIPHTLEVTVPPDGGHLDVPIQLGGKIEIEATDDRGRYPAGHCHLVGPDGVEFTPSMRGRSGERRSGGDVGREPCTTIDNLPPGPYRVSIDLGTHGHHVRDVVVVAGEVVPVQFVLR